MRNEKVFKHQTLNPLASFALAPPSTYFDTQDEKEQVVLLLRRHWITNFGWVLTALLLLISPAITMYFPETFSFLDDLPSFWQKSLISLWYLLVIGWTFEKFIGWFFNVIVVTTERVIDVDFYGILYKNVSEASLSK